VKNVKIWVPILDKRRSSCYYKKTERTLFFVKRCNMQRVFSLLVDNNPGVLSRVSGLFSRRGYSIDSITAGVTADPRFTRITIVASGDELILSQIEKQVRKLEDVIEIKVLHPEDSVYRELIMVKVRANKTERTEIISVADIFRAKIVDVEKDSLMVELTGNGSKVDAFLELLEGYEILELARTGITGLQRGIKDVTVIDQEGNINTL
jgi:acetolactate synthase-1/3 small subunit